MGLANILEGTNIHIFNSLLLLYSSQIYSQICTFIIIKIHFIAFYQLIYLVESSRKLVCYYVIIFWAMNTYNLKE